MKHTADLIDSMAAMRQQIARAYQEELCSGIDPATLYRLKRQLSGLQADLARLYERVGLGITL